MRRNRRSVKRRTARTTQRRVSQRTPVRRTAQRRTAQRRVAHKRTAQRRVAQRRVAQKRTTQRRVSQRRVSQRKPVRRTPQKRTAQRRVSQRKMYKPRRKNVFFKMIDGHMVVDPPISEKRHQGSCAVEKDHYFSYLGTENFLRFFQKVKNKFPKNLLCFPELTGPTGTRRDYQILIKHDLYDYVKNNYPNLDNKHRIFVKQHLPLLHKKVLSVTKEIKSCIKKGFRFICLDVDLRLAVGGHANIILIDTKKKTIELFEPHGGKDKQESGWYKDISSIFQDYFEDDFPNYTYVPPHKIMGVSGPQGRKPVTGISGLCMSWCSLYLHYKLLNPEIPSKVIVKRLIQLNQTFLRKYLQYVEDVIKGNETEFRMYRRAESHQPKKKQVKDDSQVNQQTIQKVEDPKKSQSI